MCSPEICLSMFSSSSNAESWYNNPMFASTRKQRYCPYCCGITDQIHSNSLKKLQSLDNNNYKSFWITFFIGKTEIGLLRKISLTAFPNSFLYALECKNRVCTRKWTGIPSSKIPEIFWGFRLSVDPGILKVHRDLRQNLFYYFYIASNYFFHHTLSNKNPHSSSELAARASYLT